MKLVSWNVNGIRAAEKKGFISYAVQSGADIICLQETKARPEQLSEQLLNLPGYQAWFHAANRKGYSGTALYSRYNPRSVTFGLDQPDFDTEGRTLIADYGTFILYNIYFPNGSASPERLKYKLDFYEAFHQHVNETRSEGLPVVVCGDVNTAHQEIDLARPAENVTVSGFLPEERAFIDRFLTSGFDDTFRLFNQEGNQYTWWDMKTRARDRNVGWRIDYFFTSQDLRPLVKNAWIEAEKEGSDHCPVGLELAIHPEEE